jgi:deoxyribose-phosphate aldolase
VIGFPLGATLAEVKAYETQRVVAEGACEVDMVMNVGALKSGDYRAVERDIAGVVRASRPAGALSKVILETALLTDDEKPGLRCLPGPALISLRPDRFGPGATVADVAFRRRSVVGSAVRPPEDPRLAIAPRHGRPERTASNERRRPDGAECRPEA